MKIIDEMKSTIQKLTKDNEALTNEIHIVKENNDKLLSEIGDLQISNYELEESNVYLNNAFICLKKLLLNVISKDADYKELYNFVSHVLDPDGYRLYDVAEEMTEIDICSFFSAEDNLGYFEVANGSILVDWIVKAKFGKIEWEPLNPPHEIAAHVTYEGQEENVSNFYKELYKKTFLQLIMTTSLAGGLLCGYKPLFPACL